MVALLSPSKTLDFDRPRRTSKFTIPEHLDDAEKLMGYLRELDEKSIQSLMGVNEEIATLSRKRFESWGRHELLEDGMQAIFAYVGEVYRGLDVDRLSAEDLYYAQNHLRILSGLYGSLRPLDIVQPYRLEMGAKLSNERGNNLYSYWGSRITESISEALRRHSNHVVVNLASQEYFAAVGEDGLDGTVITPLFKEKRNDKYRTIAVYAKNARGRMARFMIQNRIESPGELKEFDEDGYRFNPEPSSDREWVFTR